MNRHMQPSPAELLGHHVKYEFDQMIASFKMLGNVRVPREWSTPDEWQKALNNALMESFYVHARSLFEFFNKRRGARKHTEASYKPFVGVDISIWVRKLNNQVAHLLEGRTADDSLKISHQDRIDMLDALGKELDLFKKALKPEYSSIRLPTIPNIKIEASGQSATNAPHII